MKSALTAGLLALFLQRVQADSWGSAQPFPNPSNTNNNCSADQQSGFDWSALPTGSFTNFGGFDFSGFQCSNSFSSTGASRRKLALRDDFQSKCIQGTVSKDAGSAPKIACGSGQDFSITTMQVSVSFDTDLDFLFDMPDGSTCMHTASCSASGTTVTNDQCGGAQSVSFQMPDHGSDFGCDIGIHSVGFDCQSASTLTPTLSTASSTSSVSSSTSSSTIATIVSTSTTSSVSVTTSSSTSPTVSNSSPTSPVITTSTTSSTTLNVVSTSQTSTPSSTLASATSSSSGSSSTSSLLLTTSTVFSTTEIIVTSCGPEVVSCPARSTTVVTSTFAVSTTTCPVKSHTGGPQSSPPAEISSQSTVQTPGSTETQSISVTSSVTATTTPTSVLPVSSPAPTPSTSEVITTEIVVTTLTTCPVTLTTTSGSSTITQVTSTISTIFSTSTTTFCTECGGGGRPPFSTPTAIPPSTSVGPQSSPPVSSPLVSSPPVTSTTNTPLSTTATVTTSPTDVITTKIVISTMTTCPVTVTHTFGGSTSFETTSTVSTVFTTSTSTVCTRCNAPPPSTFVSVTSAPQGPPAPPTTQQVPGSTSTSILPASSSSQPPPSGPPPPDAPCPAVLPSCLNTWLSIVPTCTSNSDTSCFCPNQAFISQVQACVSAWSGNNDADIQAALSYLAGICADFVPQNPGICTNVPSSITLMPSPPPATTPVVAISTAPGTTLTITQTPQQVTTTVPAPVTTVSYTQTISTGTTVTIVTTQVTVPQVTFVTNTAPVQTPAIGSQPGAPAVATTTYQAVSVGLVPMPAQTSAVSAFSGTSTASYSSLPVASYTSPSPGIATFLGAAGKVDAQSVYGAIGGGLAIVALLV